MLSTTLYYKRFFPYYTYNILAGLDNEGVVHEIIPTVDRDVLSLLGKGCVYSYDPVGSYERETYRAAGSSASMLQPLLDNQVL